MLTLHTKIAAADVSPDTAVAQLELPYELREKSRLRATLSDGREVAVFSVRGSVLRDGDLLTGAEGVVARVVAAREPGYLIRCLDPVTLLRCAFHLGNRHTQAQVGNGFLRIRRDPVLKDMLLGLGAQVLEEEAAFEPECGAYGGGHGHAGDAHLLAPVPVRQQIHRAHDPR